MSYHIDSNSFSSLSVLSAFSVSILKCLLGARDGDILFVWGSVKSPATAGHNTDFCCCCCCCCVEGFIIQILSFRAWMLKVECKNQNLTTPHWLFFSTPQWTSTRHLSSNPTSFDSHASGCYPWWGNSNTFSHFQCFADLLQRCDYYECGCGSLMSSPAALIPDPPQLDFPSPAEAVEGWWHLFFSVV